MRKIIFLLAVILVAVPLYSSKAQTLKAEELISKRPNKIVHIEFKKSFLEKEFKHEAWVEDTRIVPIFSDGNYLGIKFLALKKGSYFGEIFKRGDILFATNKILVTAPNLDSILPLKDCTKSWTYSVLRQDKIINIIVSCKK